MTNHPKILGDCYKKFNLAHTSKSQNTIPDDIRFRNYIVLTPKEKAKLPSNCSFTGGTIAHEIIQSIKCKNKTFREAVKLIQDKITNYDPIDEKDKIKFNYIIENLEPLIQNHLDNIDEIPKQDWKAELEYTHWADGIKTYFLSYVDLVGSTNFGDIKNVFGTLTKTKNGFSYSKKKCPRVPYHSDCLQIALYSKLLPKHKPFLTYASNDDRVIFTPENCVELRTESLQYYYEELVLYQKCWETKLELANGDAKVLAMLCKPDLSEIRKDGFWWKGIDPDIIKRFRSYYE
jgi:hypothetical protein|tara:strand:+ start:722 stop:1591 length:870 start_codon:yes stop_codon:yes gene_type:complete